MRELKAYMPQNGIRDRPVRDIFTSFCYKNGLEVEFKLAFFKFNSLRQIKKSKVIFHPGLASITCHS